MPLTKELIIKARAASNPEEIKNIAAEAGIKLEDEEAKKYYDNFHKEGKLEDDELDNVAGGTCYSKGMYGPDGWGHYAIVTYGNTCDGSNDGRGNHTNCYNCIYAFSTDFTTYCEIRTEENDKYK